MNIDCIHFFVLLILFMLHVVHAFAVLGHVISFTPTAGETSQLRVHGDSAIPGGKVPLHV